MNTSTNTNETSPHGTECPVSNENIHGVAIAVLSPDGIFIEFFIKIPSVFS